MADTDPTQDNINKLLEFKRKAQRLLGRHEHGLPVTREILEGQLATSYYCMECGHPKGGHHSGCAWEELLDG